MNHYDTICSKQSLKKKKNPASNQTYRDTNQTPPIQFQNSFRAQKASSKVTRLFLMKSTKNPWKCSLRRATNRVCVVGLNRYWGIVTVPDFHHSMSAFFGSMSTGAFTCDAVDSLKFTRVGLTQTLNRAKRALKKKGKRHADATENMFGTTLMEEVKSAAAMFLPTTVVLACFVLLCMCE